MENDKIIELVLDLSEKVPKAKGHFDVFSSYEIERLAEKYKKEILINGKMLHSAEEKNNKRKFNEEYSNRLQEIITKGISYGIFEDF